MPEGLAQLDIDAGRGLVQHDDGWLVHQGLRDQHAALHAARELAHIGIRLVGQAQAFEQLVDPGVVVAHTEIARLDAQRFTHIEEGVEHELLGHDAELAAGLRVVGLHVVAQDADLAARGAHQAGEDADEGRLAGAVRAEQAEELALFDGQADVVKRGKGGALGTARERVDPGNRLELDGRHENPPFYRLHRRGAQAPRSNPSTP